MFKVYVYLKSSFADDLLIYIFKILFFSFDSLFCWWKTGFQRGSYIWEMHIIVKLELVGYIKTLVHNTYTLW
jgi:hypothetical protein